MGLTPDHFLLLVLAGLSKNSLLMETLLTPLINAYCEVFVVQAKTLYVILAHSSRRALMCGSNRPDWDIIEPLESLVPPKELIIEPISGPLRGYGCGDHPPPGSLVGEEDLDDSPFAFDPRRFEDASEDEPLTLRLRSNQTPIDQREQKVRKLILPSRSLSI
jgi:hypothetical protein